MGVLRILGAAVFLVGIVGFVLSLALWVDYATGVFGGSLVVGMDPAGAASAFLVNVVVFGLLWGPVAIVVGLVFLYTSARMREEAATSS